MEQICQLQMTSPCTVLRVPGRRGAESDSFCQGGLCGGAHSRLSRRSKRAANPLQRMTALKASNAATITASASSPRTIAASSNQRTGASGITED